MARGGKEDWSILWRPGLPGVEVLHARFRRHEYPRHSHDAITVAAVDVGVASFRYRGAKFIAPAGCLFVLDADVVHTGGLADPDGYGYRVLYLNPDLVVPLLGDGSARAPVPRFREPVLWDRELRVLLDKAHVSLRCDVDSLRQQELLLNATATLFARYGQIPRESGSDSVSHRAVATAKEYLEAHATERVSLHDLSVLVGCSPYHLSRMFRDQVGMPPHEYQTQLKVRRARSMLAARKPAIAVAAEAGFFDQAHFTRVFKRYTGVTPGQFSRTQ